MLTHSMPKNISKYTVLITTSGIGSRLGDFSQFTNKSLVVLGGKPAISHIIEKYPKDSEYVITLGYFGEHIREFLELAYPERNFRYVDVFPYEGEGSSLAYSMLCAKEHLQKPFIFHACDSLILKSSIPMVDSNWVAGYVGKDASNYTSFDTQRDLVERFNPKGMTNFDFIHIGVVGIFSFNEFWEKLREMITYDPNNNILNDVSVLNELVKKGIEIKVKIFDDWIDIGNSNSLIEAKKVINDEFNILEKANESISFINDSVIKFFSDSKVVSKRVGRIAFLGETVPKLKNSTKHFYTYEFYKGAPMSTVLNPDQITTLLHWTKDTLWSFIPMKEMPEMASISENFYFGKSNDRLEEFTETRMVKDEITMINNERVPSAKELILEAKMLLVSELKIGRFHGDLILDNILISELGFKLIDWREDFGGSSEFGDIYYDLAKLNHSLYINHSLVLNGDFFIDDDKTEVTCGILRKDVHVKMESNLQNFIEKEKLNWRKVQVLTGLIWLNMSPLHHHPFDKFLYYYGRYNLWRSLRDIK